MKLTPFNTLAACCLAVFSLAAPAHAITAVYSNVTTDTGFTAGYAVNGFTQIGDQISLAGAARLATLATVQFFNNGTEGTFDATLRFFNLGAPVGTQIGSDYSLTSISAPSGDVFNVSFSLPGLLVPDNLIFTVSVANPGAGVDIVGLDMFEPPTVGTSDNSFAIANNGSGFITVLTDVQNVYFELQADTVPEPGTIVFALTSFALIACVRRRIGVL